uniref:Ig-like domain-containing protein n=1 Tax=Pyxicephalus adspersus TaxID=30357 RepID=A0AAV3ABJ3_PYXAD|nr:TPA: hypothetical protein GDO54_011939 [Pyxicephalus adspersus]
MDQVCLRYNKSGPAQLEWIRSGSKWIRSGSVRMDQVRLRMDRVRLLLSSGSPPVSGPVSPVLTHSHIEMISLLGFTFKRFPEP